MSRRGATVISLVLALVCLVTGVVGHRIAVADPVREPSRPVDVETAQTISLAALSCPALNGPRLAAQLMANSGMAVDRADGVAAMPAATFEKWAPWPGAVAQDTTASVYALAHHMCDLVGEVRVAGVDGDQWRAALAAYHSGIDAVRTAGEVPDPAQDYVSQVAAHTVWYADQAVFGGPNGSAVPATVTARGVAAPGSGSPVPVPAEYVPTVGKAGAVCPQVTPARVAAQLMASSGFNPNVRSADRMGIAQFRAQLWSEYGPAGNSPWDPHSAIAVLGRTMCALVKTLAPLGGDSYRHALAAFQVGAEAVRAAGGMPPVPSVADFVDRTVSLNESYSSLSVVPSASTSPSPVRATPSPSPQRSTASPRPSPSVTRTPSPGPTPSAPTQYRLVNVHSKKAMTVPNGSKAPNQILVQQPDRGGADQRWLLVRDRNGHVRIKSVLNNLVLSPLGGSKEPYAFAAQVPDASTAATRWRLDDIGGGLFEILNEGSGLLLALQFMVDTDGTRLFQHPDNGTVDHLWRLVPVKDE
ncbi:RICIN domain-containing protein [Micromonospora sp. LOL_024]|uniref:RICIN domain-containing protein n=1 Tax=Micromonospora sp. LOL_024 TaxID=3345412 RepID=UPI003A8BA385